MCSPCVRFPQLHQRLRGSIWTPEGQLMLAALQQKGEIWAQSAGEMLLIFVADFDSDPERKAKNPDAVYSWVVKT